VISVPMRLLCTLLPVAPAPMSRTPDVVLPETEVAAGAFAELRAAGMVGPSLIVPMRLFAV